MVSIHRPFGVIGDPAASPTVASSVTSKRRPKDKSHLIVVDLNDLGPTLKRELQSTKDQEAIKEYILSQLRQKEAKKKRAAEKKKAKKLLAKAKKDGASSLQQAVLQMAAKSKAQPFVQSWYPAIDLLLFTETTLSESDRIVTPPKAWRPKQDSRPRKEEQMATNKALFKLNKFSKPTKKPQSMGIPLTGMSVGTPADDLWSRAASLNAEA